MTNANNNHNHLSRAQRQSLQALVDALLPSLDVPSSEQQSSLEQLSSASTRTATSRRHDDIEQRNYYYWRHSLATDVHFLRALEYGICHQMNPYDCLAVKTLLSLLSSSLGTSLVFGRPSLQPFYRQVHKTAWMQGLQHAPLPTQRQVFCSLKRFICGVAYSYCKPTTATAKLEQRSSRRGSRQQQQRLLPQRKRSTRTRSSHHDDDYDDDYYTDNPHFAAMGYRIEGGSNKKNDPVHAQKVLQAQKDQAPIQKALVIQTNENNTSQHLECDVLIIGSGAGGSMATSVLLQDVDGMNDNNNNNTSTSSSSRGGQDVILVERGSYIPPTEAAATTISGGGEAQALDKMYEQSGLVTNTDGTIAILAGNTLGGGTAVNWNACLPLPASVRDEWAQKYGLQDFATTTLSSSPFDESLQYVCSQLAASCDGNVHHNVPNIMLQKACTALGYEWHAVAQNLRDTTDQAGSVHLGDAHGNKQTSLTLFLKNAAALQQQTSETALPLSSSSSSSTSSSSPSSVVPPKRPRSPPSSSSPRRLRILDNCQVDRIVTQPVSVVGTPFDTKSSRKQKQQQKERSLFTTQRATGAVCRIVNRHRNKNDSNSSSSSSSSSSDQTVTITARKCIVLSAGALQTPCILQRSDLAVENKHVGKHLYLHPTTAVAGFVASPGLSSNNSNHERQQRLMDPWKGAILTTACTQFVNSDENEGYGCLLEVPAAHPGLLATGLPWTTPEQFKDRMRRLRHSMALILVQRDSGPGGSVRSTHNGQRLEIRYKISAQNAASLMQGTLGALQVLAACPGMEQISSPHNRDTGLHLSSGPASSSSSQHDDSDTDVNQKLLGDYLDKVQKLGNTRPHDVPFFSAHQMGTCRMGTSPQTGATDCHGELWDCQDLFVMDASLFPTATGVNPMITVMTVAHMLAKRLALRLAWRDVQATRQKRQHKSSSTSSSIAPLSATQAHAAGLERHYLAHRMAALHQDHLRRRQSTAVLVVLRVFRNIVLWIVPLILLCLWLDLPTLLLTG